MRLVGLEQGWVILEDTRQKGFKCLSVKSLEYNSTTHESAPKHTVTTFSSTTVQKYDREMLLKVQISC